MNPLSDVLLHAARSRPAAPFLDTPAGTTWTYADLDAASGRLAHALQQRGVRGGDRVAVQTERSADAIALHLACVRAGAVYLPLNPAYVASELDELLADAAPALFVGPPAGTAHEVPSAMAQIGLAGLVAEAAAHPGVFADVPRTDDDPAAMLYTSGTTGRPKGAVLSHRNLAFSAQTLTAAWGFTADDVLLHTLPLFHTHGLFVAVHCTLVAGSSLILLDGFDPGGVCAQLPRATMFMGVPTYYVRLLADPAFSAEVAAGVRLFTSGSAPMLVSTHEQFRARTGQTILERYGMTETCMLTSNPLDGPRRPGTVGPPLPGVGVRIAGDDVGAVEVRGPNVFDGYWRRPELRESEFTADGWFVTGDLGRFDEHGYLEIVGRSKDLVISGGLNVYPKEVEQVLDALPGVLESAVVGVPHADLGEAVVAAVVAQEGVQLDPGAVRAAARERLAGFKVPKQVHVVAALPRNAMGKVEKARLRAQLEPPPR